MCAWIRAFLLVSVFGVSQTWADEPAQLPAIDGDQVVARYFAAETRRLTEASLADIQTADDWDQRRDEYRRQLFEMLSLDPLPQRTPLKAEVTGVTEHELFRVERIHFQSRPGLYVTGNLYVPKQVERPLPAILYVCGHGRVKKDGISYGSKTHYQHHGAWFARNGYVCLTIDTLQLGEIEGIHHGTYRYGMWWWNSRGYSPAGVEAWNCIRALDYLETRPEVDADRFGVTGRSGGGAYSWWVAALDERIKVAVPVAGITSLHNHVVDGCVEGHCDCMYQVNTYRWDYPQIAALVAPRALLISNTDKDGIFPLDGVVDVYVKTRRIYDLLGVGDRIGLHITEGPHKDTQELRIHAFRWFNRFLKDDDSLIDLPAEKLFEPEQLRVFDKLPEDQKNTEIHESFTAVPEAQLPEDIRAWDRQRSQWLDSLRQKTFGGWPANSERPRPTKLVETDSSGIRLSIWQFDSQPHVPLRLYVLRSTEQRDLQSLVLVPLDDQGWARLATELHGTFPEAQTGLPVPAAEEQPGPRILMTALKTQPLAVALVAPRGIGPTAWSTDERKRVQIRRRFMLLGQTLDGMRVWDVRQAYRAVRQLPGMSEVPVRLRGEREMAGIALYAAAFEPSIARVDLVGLASSHRDGPTLLNVQRILDIPQAVAAVATDTPVRLQTVSDDAAAWNYPSQVAERLGWNEDRLEIVTSER